MADVVFYKGASGQTLYVRIQTGASTFVATALAEGATSMLNHYSAVDSTIAALTGMNVAGDYPFQVRAGGTPSTTAADTLVATGILGWTGSTETAASVRRIFDKLPSSNYLTGTSSSAGALNLTAAIGTLAAAHFSAGALQRISPQVLYTSAIDTVNSQTSVEFLETDRFQNTDDLAGALLITTDGLDFVWAAITGSSASAGSVALSLTTHNGTIHTTDALYLVVPLETALSFYDKADRTQLATILTAIQNVQNNTFVTLAIPQVLEKPDSSSVTVQIVVTFADETGTAKNLDSGSPTMTLVNDAGTDLSARLGSWTNPATGKYVRDYTNSATDTVEGLHWDVTGTVNSKSRRAVAYTQIVDTSAVDFTSADRTKLTAVYNKLPSSNYFTGTSNSSGALNLSAATGTLAASHFSSGALQRINPNMTYTSTIGTVTSQVSVAFAETDRFQYLNALAGALLITTDGLDFVWAAVTGSSGNGSEVSLALTPHAGTINVGDVFYLLIPNETSLSYYAQADSTKLAAIFDKLPSKSHLVGTNNADGDVQLNEATGEFTTNQFNLDVIKKVNPAVIEVNTIDTKPAPNKITFAGADFYLTGETLNGCLFIASDGVNKFFSVVTDHVNSDDVNTLTLEGTTDVLVPSMSFVLLAPPLIQNDRTRLGTIYNKLPSRPYLTGTTFADGTLNMEGASGLSEAIATALENGEFEFPEELLDVLRDHLMGGKQYLSSRVDVSVVTPTATQFAGHAELSAETGFYSKTNSVLAFVSGTLQGLCNTIVEYDGPLRRFRFDDAWPDVPAPEDKFILLGKITSNTT